MGKKYLSGQLSGSLLQIQYLFLSFPFYIIQLVAYTQMWWLEVRQNSSYENRGEGWS